ncbi:hypothetical protein C3468_07300 [Serratia marcescens]|nr:hypothetical protein AM354_02660 [Serratia marcescens]POX22304.1 hypothetical protein C3468_07300 [Serratia marcescens]
MCKQIMPVRDIILLWIILGYAGMYKNLYDIVRITIEPVAGVLAPNGRLLFNFPLLLDHASKINQLVGSLQIQLTSARDEPRP